MEKNVNAYSTVAVSVSANFLFYKYTCMKRKKVHFSLKRLDSSIRLNYVVSALNLLATREGGKGQG